MNNTKEMLKCYLEFLAVTPGLFSYDWKTNNRALTCVNMCSLWESKIIFLSLSTLLSLNARLLPSPERYVLKIHFFIEFGLKMIQFKIKFKTKSKIFIQKNINSIESKIFNKIIHSQKMRKIIQNSKIRPKSGFGALLKPLYR